MKNNIIAIDTSKEYSFHVDKHLERSKNEILEWFCVEQVEFKVNVYIYQDITNLRMGLQKRGLGLYPAHMVACMVDENLERGITRSINLCEPPIISDNQEYTKKEYDQVIYHELIHYITDLLFGILPEWLTEGIAKYLDGSYQKGINYLMENYINKYEIPDIATMKNDFFVAKKYEKVQTEVGEEIKEITIYDGYDLGYIMICYLLETQGKDYLLALMRNKESIKELEQSILTEAIAYFNCQYSKENTIKI